ncbi:MAG: rhomboid family intramembrane serine protease [Clostridiales bacterium]|nr:rhomboid family intramembrane serine protease [Clostridiales bacterium]
MENDFTVNIPKKRLYINRNTPIVTYILIALCVLVYILDAISELFLGTPMLTLLGAKINYYIFLGNQYHRLFTPMFLHSGIMHIFFNMFALFAWGRQLEALLGRARYLFVYIASGVLGCCCSYAFSSATSVGASGAIFGLFGALLYFRKDYKEVFNTFFGVQVLIIIAINILNGFIAADIDNFGHIGGLIGGFIACGITGFYGQKQRPMIRIAFSAILAVLVLGLVIGRNLYYISL